MKITQYGSLTSPQYNDLLITVDVDDTSMAATGTDKKATLSSLLNGAVWPSADTSGATDTANIQGLLNLAGLATLQEGTFYINAPLSVPTLGKLTGVKGNVYTDTLSGSIITAAAGFSGGQMITLAAGVEQEVSGLTLNGASVGSGIHGISPAVGGTVSTAKISDVIVTNATGHGIVSPGGVGWRIRHCYVGGAGLSGYSLSSTDSTYEDLSSISAGAQGFIINNPTNSKFTDCRAEWGSNHGFNITGDDTATGGVAFVNCTTDRNAKNGFEITATGNWPIVLSGCTLRRDGSSATGNAAINYNNATCPVIVDGVSVFPGFNDDGSGTQSPQYGIFYTPNGGGGSFLSVANTLLHVISSGTPLGGTTPDVVRAVTTRTATWNTQPLTSTQATDVAGNATFTANNGSGPVVAVTNTNSSAFVELMSALGSGLTAGQEAYMVLGRDSGTKNAASFGFLYNGSGLSTNAFFFNFNGTSNILNITAGGAVSGVHNTFDDGSGNSTTTGVAAQSGGTDTSGTATASSPSFTSNTPKQLSTTQDVMLYIAVQTSAALSVAIGPTSTPANTIMPSKSYALSMNTIRVPKSWYVNITGTIADLTITQVTC